MTTVPRTVTVTGHGQALVTPDAAVVRVAATHRAAGVAEACAGVEDAVTRLLQAARAHAVEDGVGTTDLQVWPAHDRDGQPAGFEARHGVAVRVASVSAAGEVLAALTSAVGDDLQVEGISLEVTDSSAAQTEAREAAWGDAVARATQLADLTGTSLGEVLTVAEGGGSAPAPVAELRLAKADGGGLGEIAPGQRAVTASLSVTWALV